MSTTLKIILLFFFAYYVQSNLAEIIISIDEFDFKINKQNIDEEFIKIKKLATSYIET